MRTPLALMRFIERCATVRGGAVILGSAQLLHRGVIFMVTSLIDKVAILTGASDGIGREIAYLLGKEGASVVLAARREDRLNEVARQIEASGGRATVVPTDLRDP